MTSKFWYLSIEILNQVKSDQIWIQISNFWLIPVKENIYSVWEKSAMWIFFLNEILYLGTSVFWEITVSCVRVCKLSHGKQKKIEREKKIKIEFKSFRPI